MPHVTGKKIKYMGRKFHIGDRVPKALLALWVIRHSVCEVSQVTVPDTILLLHNV